MPFTQLGNTPQNQLDALPIISADTAAAGGIISFQGGSLTRYWSTSVLGIQTSVFAADPNGYLFLATPFLDWRGCRTFTLMLRRNLTGAGITLAIMELYAQLRFTNGEVPLVSLGAVSRNTEFLAAFKLTTDNIVFPASQTNGETQTITRSWNVAQPGNSQPAFGTIGTDVRLVLFVATAPAGANTFSASLWGAA